MTTAGGRAETEPRMSAEGRAVSPDYFALLRIPLVAGEMCRTDPQSRDAMVNRSFVNAYWPDAPPLGRRLLQVGRELSAPIEIRGVVGDARETGLDKSPTPTLYWCGGGWQPGSYFLVRTHGDPRLAAETVRRKMREVEPLRSIYDLSPLTSHISDGYAENRMRTILLTFFALAAVSLVSVGIYGTFGYLVKLRQREVSLRLALGARVALLYAAAIGNAVWRGAYRCYDLRAGDRAGAGCVDAGVVGAGGSRGVRRSDAGAARGVRGFSYPYRRVRRPLVHV
jgi:nitrate reductase NapE component